MMELLNIAAGRRGIRYVLLDICGVWGGGGESGQGQGGELPWNSNSVGDGGDGHGLHCWPHLRCPFQPCCHHCFRLLQEVPLETGKLISFINPTCFCFKI